MNQIYFKPINKYNAEQIQFAANETAFWSVIYKITWVVLVFKKQEYFYQDETLVKLDTNWALHSIYIKDDVVTVLYGTTNKDDILIKLIEQLNFIKFEVLSLHNTVEYLYTNYTQVYINEEWGRFSWKWVFNTQQIIADYLDLISGGWIEALPKNFNIWNDEKILINLPINDYENITFKANFLNKKLNESGVIYMQDAYKKNLGFVLNTFM
jgi:hypothetical protein